MKVLLLGPGMQGKAALHDLAMCNDVDSLTAADLDIAGLEAFVRERGFGPKVSCAAVDAADPAAVDRLLSQGFNVMVDLLPVPLHDTVTEAAVEHGIHLVNSSYPGPGMLALADEAATRGVTILPECGMDPGIDLVLLGEAVRSLDSVESIVTYGAGFPEPAAADNALRYKVTWNFEGVLGSYRRAARVIRDGAVVDIPASGMFHPANIHEIIIDELGALEAFPNGDALKYLAPLGLEASDLQRMERCVLRWPGHSALWKEIVEAGLLDDEPVDVDGMAVDRKRFLAEALGPYLRYGPRERDVVVVRVDVRGRKGGGRARAVHELIDRRDLDTGFFAMNRTVGFAASIGAQLIGRGEVTRRGLLSPLADVPFEAFARELAKRGIEIASRIETE
jgi:saccharopine dehydrogenase-like NADP-dependent oxidoreductase